MISLRSKVTIKILNYFFLNPHARNYGGELSRVLDADSKNIHTKLVELEKNGVLKSEFSGRQRYFTLNTNFPLLGEYKKIILKTVGIEQSLKSIVQQVDGVINSYIFGSYAKNTMDEASDIDLLVIGNHSAMALQKEINRIQKEIDREINVINMTEHELEEKKRAKNAFIKNIFSGKIIQLL